MEIVVIFSLPPARLFSIYKGLGKRYCPVGFTLGLFLAIKLEFLYLASGWHLDITSR